MQNSNIIYCGMNPSQNQQRSRTVMAEVFITGATGYLGRPLVAHLLGRGHEVRALVRSGQSTSCQWVEGNALDSSSFAANVRGYDTLVHLVGTPKPAPWKAKQFEAVDKKSLEASLTAAQEANVRHLVFLSVAQPSPVMRAYVSVRQECEARIRASSVSATFLRPFYVLGESHWWPLALVPLYKMAEAVPGWRDSAIRLGLVRRQQMVNALAWAVENPPEGMRIMDVARIREF